MLPSLRSLLLLALMALPVFSACTGTNPVICNNPSGDYQIKPQAIPVSPLTVTTTEAYLKVLSITNITSSAVTVTLSDRQTSPIAFLKSVSIAGNTTYILSWPDKALQWLPGGFTITASDVGLNFFVAWR